MRRISLWRIIVTLSLGVYGWPPSVAGGQMLLPQAPRIRYAPRGLPKRRVGAGVRGATARRVAVMAPQDHLAETESASPELHWRLDSLGAKSVDSLTFRLERLGRNGVRAMAFTAELPFREGALLHRVRLDSIGVQLRPGQEYLWAIRVRYDDGTIGESSAYIRRRAGARPAVGNAFNRARTSAGRALWYDAFSALADTALADPAPSLQAMRERFRMETIGRRAYQ